MQRCVKYEKTVGNQRPRRMQIRRESHNISLTLCECFPRFSSNRLRYGGVVEYLADRTNGREYATVLRPSVVCLSSVALCIVAER